MDRPGVCQVPEGCGEQGKMEETGCKIICGAPATFAVKGLMMMMFHVFNHMPGGATIDDSGLCCCVPCLLSAVNSTCLFIYSADSVDFGLINPGLCGFVCWLVRKVQRKVVLYWTTGFCMMMYSCDRCYRHIFQCSKLLVSSLPLCLSVCLSLSLWVGGLVCGGLFKYNSKTVTNIWQFKISSTWCWLVILMAYLIIILSYYAWLHEWCAVGMRYGMEESNCISLHQVLQQPFFFHLLLWALKLVIFARTDAESVNLNKHGA